MDPVSIVGMVAAAVQFLDFGARLFDETVAGYRGLSGIESRVVDLDRVSRDLQELSRAVSDKLTSVSRRGGSRTIGEIALLEQCRRCKAAGQDLIDSVSKIRKGGLEHVDFGDAIAPTSTNLSQHGGGSGRSKFESFKVALRLVYKRGQIDKLGASLSHERSELLKAMITHMWERMLVQDEAQPSNGEPSTRNDILIRQSNSKNYPSYMSTLYSSMSYSHQKDDHPSERDAGRGEAACTSAVLQSLVFDSIDRRLQAIPMAYERTLTWALQQPRSSSDSQNQPLWSDLPDWLERDTENVYWVAGKPGSGKSTLMRYLTLQPRVLASLQKWSAPRRVLVAAYYSWNAGSSLQKSQQGLLRTLLVQIIRHAPELAPKLFPGRWAILQLFGLAVAEQLPPWTYDELNECITSLTSSVHRDFNIAMFVDGLDEFDGDHSSLIELMKHFHNQPGLKVCVSSRPWNEFRDSFVSCPSLRMELLTKLDMITFVRGRLSGNIAFMELKKEFSTEAEELERVITEKAMGVFLWVSVVTSMLLTRLSDGEDLAQAKAILDELPTDISSLYESLWKKVKSEYRSDATRILMLFRAYTESPNVAARGAVDYPSTMPVETLWYGNDGMPVSMDHISRTLTRRLNSRTMGLLEISPYGEVGYLHQTAQDWIMKFWVDIESDPPKDFDPHLGLLKAQAKQLSAASKHSSEMESLTIRQYDSDVWGRIMACLYHASKLKDNTHNYDHLVSTVDDIGESVRALCLKQKPRDYWVPAWVSKECGSLEQFGFISLAAEYGVAVYLRAKVISSPDYLMATGDNHSLLDCLLLGPRDWFTSLVDVIDERTLPFRKLVGFRHAARYQLVAEFLALMTTKSRSYASQRAASSLKKLRQRHRTKAWQKLYSHEITESDSTGGNQISYYRAVTQLLKSYRNKGPLTLMIRSLERSVKGGA